MLLKAFFVVWGGEDKEGKSEEVQDFYEIYFTFTCRFNCRLVTVRYSRFIEFRSYCKEYYLLL